jgi:hypothetical protein
MSIDRQRLAREHEEDSRWNLSGAEEDPGRGNQQELIEKPQSTPVYIYIYINIYKYINVYIRRVQQK